MKLTILGINSAFPSHGRHPSSIVLQDNNNTFLIDCGETIQFQLHKFNISASKIDVVFITHLHGDHYFGLIGLITTLSMSNKTSKLKVICPLGLKDIINIQLQASNSTLSFELEFVELTDTKSVIVFENKNFIIKTIPLDHKIYCMGYLFEQKEKEPNIHITKIEEYSLSIDQIKDAKQGKDILLSSGTTIPNSELIYRATKAKKFAYCSDTAFSSNIIPLIQNVDLLYHECTFMIQDSERAEYTKHSTTHDVGNIANKAKAKKLLIGHFSSRYKDLNPLFNEVLSIFENTILGSEGKVIEI